VARGTMQIERGRKLRADVCTVTELKKCMRQHLKLQHNIMWQVELLLSKYCSRWQPRLGAHTSARG
jgi:hypothetical protein